MSETAAGVLSNASPVGFLVGRIVSAGATTDVMINALEQKGIARSLAEPNLVALSGDTASFLAGAANTRFRFPGPSGASLSTTRNMVLDLPSRRLINQSIDLGSRITDAMRVYSDDMRHKRLSMAEEKAYALPAKLASGAVRGHPAAGDRAPAHERLFLAPTAAAGLAGSGLPRKAEVPTR